LATTGVDRKAQPEIGQFWVKLVEKCAVRCRR
jgi:hypothetical protein